MFVKVGVKRLGRGFIGDEILSELRRVEAQLGHAPEVVAIIPVMFYLLRRFTHSL